MGTERVRASRRGAAYLSSAVLATLVLALVPVLFSPRFYFTDDTQAGAYGIWYSIGTHLRAGELPLFEPTRWMAGNYAAEGQWGIFNPLVLLIGYASHATTSAVLFSTVVKLCFLAVAAAGAYLLSRSYGARPEWAAVAGVLVPASGFVVYMDAASWVTGLMTWSLLPSTWWALRRTATGGNPLLPFVLGYLLVTIGYVHGTLVLSVMIAGVLLEALLARAARSFVRVLLVGVLLGLVAAAVYLPGVLTAGVTVRDSDGIVNDNFLSPDLSGFAAGTISTARPWLSGFWDPPADGPILYLSWLLPALALVSWRRVRPLVRGSAALGVVGVVVLALVLGPAELGPLRFPARLTPYVALVVLVALVVVLSRAPAPVTRARIGTAVGIVVVGGYSAYAEAPRALLSMAAAAVLAVVGVVLVARWLGTAAGSAAPPRRAAGLLVVVLAVTAVTVVLQHRVEPRSPLPDYGLPSDTGDYQQQLPGVQGDTFVVGIADDEDLRPWDQTLLSNAWYLNPASVQNVYTPLQFRAYAEALCTDPHGEACWDALGTLFAQDRTTGEPLVDLLAITNVQVLRRPDGDLPDPFSTATPPAGWSVTSRTADAVLWSRDTAVPSAGGVEWTSSGSRVTVLEQSRRTVRLHVDAVGADGGSVVLSRLAWPGYTVTGATLDDPLRDFLLRVQLPPGSSGTDVTVSFSPPGWHVELVALAVGVAGAVLWGAAAVVLDVRRRRRRPAPAAVRESVTA